MSHLNFCLKLKKGKTHIIKISWDSCPASYPGNLFKQKEEESCSAFLTRVCICIMWTVISEWSIRTYIFYLVENTPLKLYNSVRIVHVTTYWFVEEASNMKQSIASKWTMCAIAADDTWAYGAWAQANNRRCLCKIFIARTPCIIKG